MMPAPDRLWIEFDYGIRRGENSSLATLVMWSAVAVCAGVLGIVICFAVQR